MKQETSIIKSIFCIFRNYMRFLTTENIVRVILFVLLIVAFIISGRYLFYRVFIKMIPIPLIGELLILRLIAIILLAFTTILLFGTFILAINEFYLSKDIDFYISKPLKKTTFLKTKLYITYLHSSWMVFLVGLPVFMGYGKAVSSHPSFPFWILLTIFFLNVPPVIITVIITFIAMKYSPVNRAREIILVSGIAFALILIRFFRLLSPRQLMNPELLKDFMEFLRNMRNPGSEYLPSNLAAHALLGAAHLHWNNFLLPLSLLIMMGIVFYLLYLEISPYLYSADRPISSSSIRVSKFESIIRWKSMIRLLIKPLPKEVRPLAEKDLLYLFRDSTQFSHLALIFGVFIVHLINMRDLPMYFPYVRQIFSFINLALIGFFLAGMAVRFTFPLISLEGRAFWIIGSAPLSKSYIFLAKFWVGFIPMLISSECVIFLINSMIGITLTMNIFTMFIVFLMTFCITSTAACFGTIYPKFRARNVFEISSSTGGIIFMIISMLYVGLVIVLSGVPIYLLFFRGGEWSLKFYMPLLASTSLIILISVVLSALSIKIGIKSIGSITERG